MDTPSSRRKNPRSRHSSALVPTFAIASVSKIGPQRVKQIQIFAAGGVFIRANQHLFRSAAAGNQPDARLDQSHVRLRRRLNSRACRLTSHPPPSAMPCGATTTGFRRVLDRQIHILKLLHRQVQFVPLLLLRAPPAPASGSRPRKNSPPGWRSPSRRNRCPAASSPCESSRSGPRQWHSSWSEIRSTPRRRQDRSSSRRNCARLRGRRLSAISESARRAGSSTRFAAPLAMSKTVVAPFPDS